MNLPRALVVKKHRVSPFDDSRPANLKTMSNSERGKYYRRRRNLYSAHLEERVAALHEEIAALTVSRQVQQELALSQRFTPLGAAANIVNEYCSLFNHGAPVRLTVDDQDVSASLVAHVSNTQRGFLQAVMNADLRFGEFYGVGLLFDQWERYSLYHAAIKWTMKSLKVIELTEPGDLTPCNGSLLVVTITADLTPFAAAVHYDLELNRRFVSRWNIHIMALCNAEEPVVSINSCATGTSSLPPIVPMYCYTGNNIKQITTAVVNASNGKPPTRKRSNSERGKLYRSRQKNYVQMLEKHVKQLKREVDNLDLRGHSRQRVATWSIKRQPMGASFASVVHEYFSLFKYGVPVAEQGGVMNISQDRLLSSSQAGFLNGLMHPNVVFGGSYGMHELLNQWEKYSLYHAGLKYEVKSLQIMAADLNYVVRASATLCVRFTRRTIEKIFPHLLWNEALVQRLIGKEFIYPVSDTFYFDDDNKIHRLDTYVDFVATFVKVLGNIEDSMTMMESALIRQESMIGDLIEEPHSITVEETSRTC
ncbi:hypothetical protein DD237_001720 [Peronospora effusa]|uniref:BZIP domain-containing protein n=1 Tax=Peronospora effusa TaxID=542832 RepID=A0A3R7Y0U5_9STRA|nr:hypothetical protein DD237_001720 [Peronospora effusa]